MNLCVTRNCYMAAESVDVGHISHGGNVSDVNGGVVSKHETGSNASGSISRRKQQNSNGLLIARSNLDIGPGMAGGVNNNNSKMLNGKCNAFGSIYVFCNPFLTLRCTISFRIYNS